MKKKNILIVDDELDMRTFLCTFLGTCGYHPIAASNGAEGMQMAKEKKPELIILDVMLPRKGGIEMYKELKTDEELKNIPVIMLSGISKKTYLHSQSILDASDGFSVPEPEAYIEKPPEPEELYQLTEDLLRPRK